MATQLLPVEETDIDTGHFECVGGQLIERPLPTVPHGRLQRRLANLIEKQLQDSTMVVEAEVSIDRWDEKKSDWLTPDVLLSAGGGFQLAKTGHALPPASLAIEILSSGQTFSNMRYKVSILIDWGVTQVWLVDAESRSVAVFSSTDTSKSEVFYEGSLTLPSASTSILLNELFS